MAEPTKHPFFLASYTPQGGLLVHGQLSAAEADRAGETITVWHGPSGSALGLSKEGFLFEPPHNGPEAAEQWDDYFNPDLTSALDALETAVIALAQKAQKVADASQRRGDRIDAMISKIDETIAALTNA